VLKALRGQRGDTEACRLWSMWAEPSFICRCYQVTTPARPWCLKGAIKNPDVKDIRWEILTLIKKRITALGKMHLA